MEIFLFVAFTYWSHLYPLKEYMEALQIIEDNYIFLHPLSNLTPNRVSYPSYNSDVYHCSWSSLIHGKTWCLALNRVLQVRPGKHRAHSMTTTSLGQNTFSTATCYFCFLSTILFHWSSLELTYLLSTSSQIAVSRNTNLLDIIAMPY